MARIRSIHPGLFTDEAFMSASVHARLMIMGIWCEAWDDGIFEWKPITLKAKIFPVDNVDTAEILAELERLDFVKRFTTGGKLFGSIRNFCKWQRPKKPNKSGFMTDELRTYVALTEASSEPVQNQSETIPEKSPQREDGGWRMEDGTTASSSFHSEDAVAAAAAPEKISKEETERRCEQAAGFGPLSGIGKIYDLVEAGADLDDRVLPIVREASESLRAAGKSPANWLYFVPAIKDPDRKAKPSAAKIAAAVGVFVPQDTPAWAAWDDYGKRTRGKGYPVTTCDGKLGWYFPSEFPPADERAA